MGTQKDNHTTCCVVGGGPAGIMLGLLLARTNVDVTVLEKHDDFLRDFRGDTIHTSTINLMEELGLAERFLSLPHEKATHLTGLVGGTPVRICDFSALGGKYPYILFMPQWDFLNFLTEEARQYPTFHLHMGAEALDIVKKGDRVMGVTYRQNGEVRTIRADLTIACDGRSSTLRTRMGEKPHVYGTPMDVMWFRLPRKPSDGEETGGRLERGRMLVMINRGDYWQMAYLIPKGSSDKVRAGGLYAFRSSVGKLCDFMESERLNTITSWDDVKTLEVSLNRLKKWHRPGLLYIGDAAHAMSPVGGVGINLAIQDAVAAANLLAQPLKAGTVTDSDLAAVEQRRRLPIILTQTLQRIAQRRVIDSTLRSTKPPSPPPWLNRALAWGPIRRFIAQLIGLGFRPEHIRVP